MFAQHDEHAAATPARDVNTSSRSANCRMSAWAAGTYGGRNTTMRNPLHDELAHGLRTPLTSVLGYASTLLDRWESLDEEERILFVRIVYGEALRMAHSVEHVDRQLYHEFAGESPRSVELKPDFVIADAS